MVSSTDPGKRKEAEIGSKFYFILLALLRECSATLKPGIADLHALFGDLIASNAIDYYVARRRVGGPKTTNSKFSETDTGTEKIKSNLHKIKNRGEG